MPSRKQEKRRRKLRVHGPSSDAVGAPPTGRKQPRAAAATPVRTRSGREPAVPSLKRSIRKGGFMGLFMIGIGTRYPIKYRNPDVRAKHVKYWTAKA